MARLMAPYRSIKIIFITLILLFFICVRAYALGINIVILSTHNFSPYTVTEKAIVKVIDASLADVTIKRYVLALWKYKEQKLIKQINAIKPNIIITLGTPASEFIHKELPSIPQVFALVVDPWRRGLTGKNITGVCLKIPVIKQLEALVHIANPKLVGIIWTKKHSEHFNKRGLLKVANKLGVRLIIKTVYNSKQLPEALQQEITCGIKGFIMVADPVLFNSLLAVKYVIMQGIKYQIAVIGLAACYVTHGALMALQPDYNYIGEQAARMAIAKLIESAEVKIPIQYPGKYILYINLTIAKLLHIKIPQSIKDKAVLVE